MEITLAELSESEVNNRDSAITVATTARLHFGFFDPSGRTARPFGSFGLSLNQPWTRLTLSRAQRSSANGPEADRALRYLQTIAGSHGLEDAYRLDIAQTIPSHAGLGSGTQLALAVGAAFAALEGLDLSAPQIAGLLGRGTRSGIGIATFESGGAVLDSGPLNGGLPEVVARVPFPDAWRTLLLFDPDTKGLEGMKEIAAFEASPAYPEEERAALEARTVERALPALTEGDFNVFCEEVGHLQSRMGAYFSPSQGGIFTSPRVGAVLEALRAEGVTGLGQSSWGPTGFAFAQSEAEGLQLLELASKADESGSLRLVLAEGRNQGAEITSAGGQV